MRLHEGELHLRGHRALVWQRHAQRLRDAGIPVTIENLAKSTDQYDFSYEDFTHRTDYSGGTIPGEELYSLGKQMFMERILHADPKTTLVVDGTPDDNCASCMRRLLEHCNDIVTYDIPDTQTLIAYAKLKGHKVQVFEEQHPLNPARRNLVAKLPVGVVQDFVLSP